MIQKVLSMIVFLSLLFCSTASAYVSDEFESLDDAEEWAKEIGIEYYEDPDYFNCYDETFDVFYNESDDVYLDFIDGESITEGLEEVLSNRGYTYSDGIWSNEDGFYYEDSWEYMSWDEADALYDASEVEYCDECGNIIEDKYSDHDKDCPNNPQREEEREDREAMEEDAREERRDVIVIVAVIVGALVIINYLDKRKRREK